MDQSEYLTMYQVEDRHWWYVGMRRITESVLGARLKNGNILDAGCGTGANLLLLSRYGTATGLDLEALALALCQQRGLQRLVRGSVMSLPFPSGHFDLVTSFEVLYHLAVPDDQAALAELRRVLKPGGLLLLRLPAYNRLRGRHDRAVHTRHRYSGPEVRCKVSAAGFSIVRLTYANCVLFPLVAARRLLEPIIPTGAGSDVGQPPRANSFLAGVLRAEAAWLRRWSLPFGLSVLCLARKE